MKHLTKADKITIVLVLVAALGLSAYYFIQSIQKSEVVVIEVNGQVEKTFSLPQKEPLDYRVEMAGGTEYNLVHIEGNRVRVAEANCPEQVDVRQGWISKPGQALICLPHKLAVRIEGKNSNSDENNQVDLRTF